MPDLDPVEGGEADRPALLAAQAVGISTTSEYADGGIQS